MSDVMRLVKVAEPRRVRSDDRRAVGEPVALRQLRMHLGERLRRRVDKLRDAPRLRSRLVVREQRGRS